jgi:drug/metabolite transporter (DMT)-like permease
MEMVCGGLGCALAGAVSGELSDVHLAAVPARTWWALAYLVVFGSMVAYTAYVWLLGNAALPLVTTYAYVNPLVAVFLGAILLGERFTLRTAVATVVIVVGVALIVSRHRPSTRPAEVTTAMDPDPAPAGSPESVESHR